MRNFWGVMAALALGVGTCTWMALPNSPEMSENLVRADEAAARLQQVREESAQTQAKSARCKVLVSMGKAESFFACLGRHLGRVCRDSRGARPLRGLDRDRRSGVALRVRRRTLVSRRSSRRVGPHLNPRLDASKASGGLAPVSAPRGRRPRLEHCDGTRRRDGSSATEAFPTDPEGGYGGHQPTGAGTQVGDSSSSP